MGERAGRAGEAMSDGKVSVGAALSYAFSLWRTHWREIWGALALNGVACTVVCAGLFADNLNILLAGGVGTLLTTYSVYGAVVRLAFAADHPDDPDFRLGALGLQWRRMELRLFGAHILLIIFLVVLGLLLAIVLAAPLMAMMMTRGGPLPTTFTQADLLRLIGPNGAAALEAGVTLMQMILLFVVIRLSLYLPASAESGRIAVLRTWKLTRGRFWQIFAATLVLTLPTMLIMSLGSGTALSMDGQPARLAPGETFLYSLICGGWAGAAATPLTAAVQAYFYRNLRSTS